MFVDLFRHEEIVLYAPQPAALTIVHLRRVEWLRTNFRDFNFYVNIHDLIFVLAAYNLGLRGSLIVGLPRCLINVGRTNGKVACTQALRTLML